MASNTQWGSSAYAMPKATSVMDPNSMPSDAAERARAKSNEIMAALKAGDTAKAEALLGKTGDREKKVGWLKGKLNRRKSSTAALEGEEVAEQDVVVESVLAGKEKE